MKCNDVQKFAYTYLDCEFDGRERGEFETHLSICPPCRTTVEHDAVFRDLVRSRLAGQDGAKTNCDEMRERLQRRMDRAQRQRLSRTVVLPLGVAASLCLTVVGWQMGPEWLADSVDSPDGAADWPPPVAPQQVASVQVAVPRVAMGGLGAPPTSDRPAPTRSGASEWRFAPNPYRQASTHPAGAEDDAPVAEVLRGGLAPDAFARRSPFGAVRSEESLRAMTRMHVAQLPPEVTGPALRIQRYVAARVPGVGPLPVSEGAGVALQGARIAMVGAQEVVIYSYLAFSTALTVISRAKPRGELAQDPDVEPALPHAPRPTGMLLDRRSGLCLLHVVSEFRVLTMVSELDAQTLVQLVPTTTFL